MNIASIDRGAYTPVDVSVRGKTVMIENTNNLITFNKSGVEQLIQALQQALKELPEEPKYVVLLPQQSDIKHWEYFYLHHSGKILYSDYASNVYEGGAMTLDEIKAVGKHYEPFAIPAKEFKENHLGEF
ncbi:hypothetical protein [Enterococcus phage EFap05-1]|nr:hypothetical protein [Enterococcus phage EFap05-1]